MIDKIQGTRSRTNGAGEVSQSMLSEGSRSRHAICTGRKKQYVTKAKPPTTPNKSEADFTFAAIRAVNTTKPAVSVTCAMRGISLLDPITVIDAWGSEPSASMFKLPMLLRDRLLQHA